VFFFVEYACIITDVLRGSRCTARTGETDVPTSPHPHRVARAGPKPRRSRRAQRDHPSTPSPHRPGYVHAAGQVASSRRTAATAVHGGVADRSHLVQCQIFFRCVGWVLPALGLSAASVDWRCGRFHPCSAAARCRSAPPRSLTGFRIVRTDRRLNQLDVERAFARYRWFPAVLIITDDHRL